MGAGPLLTWFVASQEATCESRRPAAERQGQEERDENLYTHKSAALPRRR